MCTLWKDTCPFLKDSWAFHVGVLSLTPMCEVWLPGNLNGLHTWSCHRLAKWEGGTSKMWVSDTLKISAWRTWHTKWEKKNKNKKWGGRGGQRQVPFRRAAIAVLMSWLHQAVSLLWSTPQHLPVVVWVNPASCVFYKHWGYYLQYFSLMSLEKNVLRMNRWRLLALEIAQPKSHLE